MTSNYVTSKVTSMESSVPDCPRVSPECSSQPSGVCDLGMTSNYVTSKVTSMQSSDPDCPRVSPSVLANRVEFVASA